MSDDGEQRRTAIREEIHALATEYVRTWGDEYEDEYKDIFVSAWYLVAEVVWTDVSRRTLVEISDEQSSRYTAMGMLFAALHDPRWLPTKES